MSGGSISSSEPAENHPLFHYFKQESFVQNIFVEGTHELIYSVMLSFKIDRQE